MKLLLPLLCSIIAVTKVFAADNLVVDGNFESPGTGWPEAGKQWGSAIGEEAGNHFLSLTTPEQTSSTSVTQTVKVEAGQWLEFTGKIRVKSFTSDGSVGWHNARVQLTWKNADEKEMKPWPPSPDHSSPTEGWAEFRKFMKVPPGATTLTVSPAIYRAKSDVDFDDLVLKVVDEADVPEDAKKKAR